MKMAIQCLLLSLSTASMACAMESIDPTEKLKGLAKHYLGSSAPLIMRELVKIQQEEDPTELLSLTKEVISRCRIDEGHKITIHYNPYAELLFTLASIEKDQRAKALELGFLLVDNDIIKGSREKGIGKLLEFLSVLQLIPGSKREEVVNFVLSFYPMLPFLDKGIPNGFDSITVISLVGKMPRNHLNPMKELMNLVAKHIREKYEEGNQSFRKWADDPYTQMKLYYDDLILTIKKALSDIEDPREIEARVERIRREKENMPGNPEDYKRRFSLMIETPSDEPLAFGMVAAAKKGQTAINVHADGREKATAEAIKLLIEQENSSYNPKDTEEYYKKFLDYLNNEFIKQYRAPLPEVQEMQYREKRSDETEEAYEAYKKEQDQEKKPYKSYKPAETSEEYEKYKAKQAVQNQTIINHACIVLGFEKPENQNSSFGPLRDAITACGLNMEAEQFLALLWHFITKGTFMNMKPNTDPQLLEKERENAAYSLITGLADSYQKGSIVCNPGKIQSLVTALLQGRLLNAHVDKEIPIGGKKTEMNETEKKNAEGRFVNMAFLTIQGKLKAYNENVKKEDELTTKEAIRKFADQWFIGNLPTQDLQAQYKQKLDDAVKGLLEGLDLPEDDAGESFRSVY